MPFIQAKLSWFGGESGCVRENHAEFKNVKCFGLAERWSSAILTRFDRAARRWPVCIFGHVKQDFLELCLGRVYF